VTFFEIVRALNQWPWEGTSREYGAAVVDKKVSPHEEIREKLVVCSSACKSSYVHIRDRLAHRCKLLSNIRKLIKMNTYVLILSTSCVLKVHAEGYQ
jgi:hypothetical protein